MPKNKKPLPPEGWLIRGETSCSGQTCIEIIAPRKSECQGVLLVDTAREFAAAIIRECDHLEGKK